MVMATETKKEIFHPAGAKVLLRAIKPAADILLPGSYKEQQPRAEVIAVGPGRCFDNGVLEPIPFKVGDVVVVNGDAVVIKLAGWGDDELHAIDWRFLMGTIT